MAVQAFYTVTANSTHISGDMEFEINANANNNNNNNCTRTLTRSMDILNHNYLKYEYAKLKRILEQTYQVIRRLQFEDTCT